MALFRKDSAIKSENKRLLEANGINQDDFIRFMANKGLDFKND